MATTITVESDTLERFNRLKENTGDDEIPELSSDQFLKSLLDAWEENDESIYGSLEVSVTNIDELQERLDAMDEAMEYQSDTIEELEKQRDILHTLLEKVGEGEIDWSEIKNRIDDLETHIDGRFDEVSRR